MKRVRQVLAATLFAVSASALAQTTLLNVSYDPTRELYVDFNAAGRQSRSSNPTVVPGRRPAR